MDRSYENEEVIQRAKEGTAILQTIKERKSSWIGHILRRNSLLKHGIEGKIKGKVEAMEKQGRRRKQILYEFKQKRGYWKLKEEALCHVLWRTCFGRDSGHVVRLQHE